MSKIKLQRPSVAAFWLRKSELVTIKGVSGRAIPRARQYGKEGKKAQAEPFGSGSFTGPCLAKLLWLRLRIHPNLMQLEPSLQICVKNLFWHTGLRWLH